MLIVIIMIGFDMHSSVKMFCFTPYQRRSELRFKGKASVVW